MLLTYDAEADALYISVLSDKVAATAEIEDDTLVDVNECGGLIGIEVLGPARPWPIAELAKRFGLSPQDKAFLQGIWAGKPYLYTSRLKEER